MRASTLRYRAACQSLVNKEGSLGTVDALIAAAPTLLCAHLSGCSSTNAVTAKDADVLLSAEALENMALGATGEADEDSENDVTGGAKVRTTVLEGLEEGITASAKGKDLDAVAEAAEAEAAQRSRAGARQRAGAKVQVKAKAKGKARARNDGGGGGSGGAVAEILSGGMSMMQERQMQEMQMQQQQMQQVQMMRMRMMAIMNSNRQLKKEERQIQRHMPGGCDCCQACPPPPIFDKQTAHA